MLLVPSDPLDERRPDDYFRPEFLAGRALGLSVGLVDHDALSGGDAKRAVRRVSDSGEALYRGWMIRSEQYEALQEALADKAVTLRTKADQYRRAHELPGWYEGFRPFTAQSVWTTGPGVDGLSELLGQLPVGPAVVKDWVKSLKHYWTEAAFIPDTRDLPMAEAVVRRFLELRAEDLVGGVVLRSFEKYQPGEVRSWWVGGNCVAVTAHPDTPELQPPPQMEVGRVAPAVATLGSPFVTVDLAQRDDGEWRVIEVGDGQVSDRPSAFTPEALISAVQ